MKVKSIKKITVLCAAGTLVFTLNTAQVNASPYVSDQGIAGISKVMNEYIESASTDVEITFSTEYTNLGIANVTESLNVRKGPGADQEKVGQLPKDAGMEVIAVEENGWAHITSGKIEGYVDSQYLLTGEEAVARAKEVATLVGVVKDAGQLRFRESASLLGDTITLIADGKKVEILDVDEVLPEWIQVKYDNKEGYVSRQYLDISYELKKAVSIEELQTGETGIRAQMVSFAKKYNGGRYVWGGTTLGNGVDCSGFTQAIYRNFGYSIPRVSRSQAESGKSISSSNARAGDLFFYGKGNYIDHVGMYIGNGQIIHASNAKSGIKISSAYYKTPIKVVSYINN